MSPLQKLRIRARSGVASETLNNYLENPKRVREASRFRIETAAREEGIALPAPSAATPCVV
jgi:hypothetical protein